MKNVLFLTYYWPPAGGPGVQRAVKFCKFLPTYGWTPTVITVDEKEGNYPVQDPSMCSEVSSAQKVIRTGSFEPFELYQKLKGGKKGGYDAFVNEDSGSWKDQLARFIRGNLFIPDARRGWNKYAVKAAMASLQETKAQVIFTTSPPHSTQLIGLALKKKTGLPWVADMRDPWTDIYFNDLLSQTWPAKALNEYYERTVLENADVVLVVSEPIRQMLLKKSSKILPEKIKVLPNGFDELDFGHVAYQQTETFTITYTGTISTDYHIDAFVDAVADIVKANPELKICLRFVGKLGLGILTLIEAKGLKDILEIVPHVEHAEAVKYMVEADLLLLGIPDKKDNEGILTGKIFEYLAADTTILGVGPVMGSAARILHQCEAGQMFYYGDRNGIKLFIEHKIEGWKTGRRDANLKKEVLKYSRREQAGVLALVFETLNQQS